MSTKSAEFAGDLDLGDARRRSQLAPDGVDEKQLREWERGCAEDMRKAQPIRIKTFEV